MDVISRPILTQTDTGSAGTAEWLQASRNMRIVAYTDTSSPQSESLGTANERDEEPLVGTHLREAIHTLGKLING